jgi:hypothetical protein
MHLYFVQRVNISTGMWFSVITAEAETRGPGLGDPVPAAVTACSAADPSAVVEAAAVWWASYWNASSVSLPSQPAVEV